MLDLGKKADRLLAVELASLYAGVSSHVADVSARQPGTGELDLLEAPLLGVQAVANARRGGGAASAHAVAAARSAVEKLLSWAVGQLDAAYSGDVVFQVSLLGDLPASGVQSLVNFKEGGRRVLLQDVDPEHLKTQAFSAKAAAYGAFVLILYFVLGVIYCMTFGMTFPVDTLLFGSGKQD